MISDTHGRAFRKGNVGIAIGVAGVPALIDESGNTDLFGRVLVATVVPARGSARLCRRSREWGDLGGAPGRHRAGRGVRCVAESAAELPGPGQDPTQNMMRLRAAADRPGRTSQQV